MTQDPAIRDYERSECAVCLSHPESCECKECPSCGTTGDPNCYRDALPTRGDKFTPNHGMNVPVEHLQRHGGVLHYGVYDERADESITLAEGLEIPELSAGHYLVDQVEAVTCSECLTTIIEEYPKQYEEAVARLAVVETARRRLDVLSGQYPRVEPRLQDRVVVVSEHEDTPVLGFAQFYRVPDDMDLEKATQEQMQKFGTCVLVVTCEQGVQVVTYTDEVTVDHG